MAKPEPYRKVEEICMDEPVFQELMDGLTKRIMAIHTDNQDPWISSQEALALLRIKDERTLAKYVASGDIRCSKVSNKVFLYYRQSILDFIEQKAK
jgi:predicted exporter